MITKIEKVTLYVQSQADAKKFWTEKLGFKVVLEMPMGPGMTWIEVAPEGAETSMVLYSKSQMEQHKPQMVAHPSLIFYTTDADSLRTQLEQNGVVVEPMQNMPWGKMFNFFDQDQNLYMVRQNPVQS